MNENPRFPPGLRQELDAEEQRSLPAAEFDARAGAPWTDREREDFDALVRWFQTRYPTALDRLRAMRRRMLNLRQREPNS